jgi:hypothetical protein
MQQALDLQAEVELLLEELGVEPPSYDPFPQGIAVRLASDFAHELFDLLEQFSRSAERDLPRHWSRSDRYGVAHEKAMVQISAMVIEMALQYPEWSSRLLDLIVEQRDLTQVNGRTLHDSFPEVEGSPLD